MRGRVKACEAAIRSTKTGIAPDREMNDARPVVPIMEGSFCLGLRFSSTEQSMIMGWRLLASP